MPAPKGGGFAVRGPFAATFQKTDGSQIVQRSYAVALQNVAALPRELGDVSVACRAIVGLLAVFADYAERAIMQSDSAEVAL
jgi:hypothetical protein